jgi:hypothetical protein
MGRMQVDSFYSRLREGYSAAPFMPQGFQVSEPDENGLHWTNSKQIFIPDHGDLRQDCIEAVHAPTSAGHFGIIYTIKKLKEVYFWPNMRKDVERFIKSCDSCQKVKASKQKKVGPLQPLQIPGRRWESISMDLITDLPPSVNQNDSILVVVDRLSKMCHLEACTKTITSAGVARIIESRVFRYHGMPLSIVSDRDVRFTSQVWEELHARLGIQLRRSTPQHPQTDGQTENANGVLEDTLRHFVGPYQNNWEELLPVAEFAMNNAWNTTIQNTPFMLNFGQNPDTPVIASLRSRNPTVNQFVGWWSEQLSKATPPRRHDTAEYVKPLIETRSASSYYIDHRRSQEHSSTFLYGFSFFFNSIFFYKMNTIMEGHKACTGVEISNSPKSLGSRSKETEAKAFNTATRCLMVN